MDKKRAEISDDAVRKATGKSWSQWFHILDSLEAARKEHKEIVALLRAEGTVQSHWWMQTIAVEYEKARGLRKTGETKQAGYQMGVQRGIPLSPAETWELLLSPPGLALWLGRLEELPLVKSHPYRTGEGTGGEVRAFSSGKQIRLTWHPPFLKRSSTLQLRFEPAADHRCTLRVHQENLSSEEEREGMKRHWSEVLERIVEVARLMNSHS